MASTTQRVRSRLSTPRQKAVRRARLQPLLPSTLSGSINLLNALTWDVTTLPESATYRNRTAAENRQILERFLEQGKVNVRLFLPVSLNTSVANGKELVMYEREVKGTEASKGVRFGDILHKIYGFYMTTKLTPEDKEMVSLGEIVQPLSAASRFADFISGQTQFAGLSAQGNGTYVLNLK